MLFFVSLIISLPRILLYNIDPSKSLVNNIFIHQGVYAFKYKTLKSFVSWKPSDNEKKYKLEQFRALDNGIKINAIKSVSKIHLGVDTEDDLKKANEIAKDDSYK